MTSSDSTEPCGRDPHRLVFVGGLHRSGTTPLARALGAHSAVSGLARTGVEEDEGQHLQDVYPPAKAYGGPGRFAFDPRAHLTETSPRANPGSAEALWRAWSPYWDLSRPLLLEKSPPNLVMGRFLQAVFPGSALIVVLRHPVIVALSTAKWRRLLSRHPQNHTTLEKMLEHWLVAHETFAQDVQHLERVHVLRYEELVANPSGELARIQRLLALSSPIPPDSISVTRSRRYEETWEAMRTGGRLARRHRRSVENRYTERVAAFGYDLATLEVIGPLSFGQT